MHVCMYVMTKSVQVLSEAPMTSLGTGLRSSSARNAAVAESVCEAPSTPSTPSFTVVRNN